VKRSLASIFFAALLVSASSAQRQQTVSGRDFVLDKNKAYVYLLFDHAGNGARYADNEPATRIWFRLVNNCRVPMRVRTFGTPDGSLAGEVVLMHKVVRNVVSGGVEREPSLPIAPRTLRMPDGYEFAVGLSHVVLPNHPLLFSIPTSHLSKYWHIEIPYEFDLPQGKCCRPENVGGEPEMVLTYRDSYLPVQVRREFLGEE